MQFTKLSITIRTIIAMMVSFVLAIGNVSTASAVGTTAQTISFTNITTKTYGDANITPVASVSPGARTVQFSASGVCEIVAGKVQLTGAGSCSVTASHEGDATYAAATPVVRTFTVNPKTITITPTTSLASIWSNEAFPTIGYTMAAGQLVGTDTMSGVTYNYNNGIVTSTATPTEPGYYNITATPVLTSGSISNYNVTGTVGVCVKDAARRSADGAILCFSSPADLTGIGAIEFGWDRATGKFTDWVKPGQAETELAVQSSGAGQYKGGHLGAINVTVEAYFIDPTGGPGNCVSTVTGTNVSSSMRVGNGGWSGGLTTGLTGIPNSLSTNNGGFGGGSAGRVLPIYVTFSKAAGNSTGPVSWVVECYSGNSGWSSAYLSAVQSRPSISSISTNNGYVSGGTTLVISGSNFSTSPAATVTVGGVPCVISTRSATSITCVTGAGTAGTVDVVVTNGDGVTGTRAGAFTYAVPATQVPSITENPVISATSGTITTPGSTLSSTPGTWDTKGDAFTTTTYQWQICNTLLVASCTNVAGATNPTWVSTAAAAARYVRVAVTLTNDAGSTTTYSALTDQLDKSNQTITFNNFASASYGDADVTPSATSSAGSVISYSIDPSSTATCSIVAGKVRFTSTGTCVVNANSAATDQVNAATQVQRTLTIGKKALTLTPTIAKNSFWTTDTFPAVSYTASGLAAGESISGVTYNYNNGTTSVTSNPTTPGAYTMTAINPVFSVGSANNYNVTSGSTNFCLHDGAQKNASGFNVCFNGSWQTTDINELAYGWDYTQSKYTNWVKAGEAKTVLADQSNGLTQLNGAKVGNISGLAMGYYTPSVQEQVTCQVYTRGTGSSSVSFGGGSASTSASNGSAVATVSATIPAGSPTLFSASFTNAGTQNFPISWYVLCSVNGAAYAPMDVSKLSAVIKPTISTVTPSTGLPAGGNNITITGTNFGTGATVQIGGVNCPVVGTNTATSITCTVPAGTTGLADVAVTATAGTAAGATGTRVGGYSYEAATYPVPTNSVAPVISTTASGSPIPMASPIVSTKGTWNMNGDPTTTEVIKWQVCSNDQGLLCTDIAGATGTPWAATADVAGKYLRSVVTATNNGGSVTASSNIIGPFAKANQTITMAQPSNKSVGVADFTPVITYTPATPVRVATLSTTTPEVCSIVENKVRIVTVGSCTITADMPADGSFNAAPQVSTTFNVVTPTFTGGTTLNRPKWNVPYSYQYVFTNPDATFAVTSGSLPAGLTLSSTGLITGTTLEKPLVTTYNFTVSATDESGTQTVNSSLIIDKGTLEVVDSGGFATRIINGLTYVYYAPTPFGSIVRGGTYPDTAGKAVGWITLSSASPSICTVAADGRLTVLARGVCTINQTVPNQGKDWTKLILLSNVEQRLVSPPVPLKANTITFAAPASQAASAPNFTVAPSATSGVTPTVTSSTPNVCTVTGLTVDVLAPGTCTLTASSPATAAFSAATDVVRSFEVLQPPVAPIITAATAEEAVGGSALVTFTEEANNGATRTGFVVTATPTAGSFGFPATASCPTAGVACLVTGLTPGTAYNFVVTKLASIGATPANTDSAPFGPVTATLPQVIELPSPGAKRPEPGQDPFKLFPISDIGSIAVPVVTSSTPLVCTVANNMVTIVGPGTCTLTATQDGGTFRGIEYGAAPEVTVSFPVLASNPAVTTVSPLPSATVGVLTTITNTSSPGTATIPARGAWSAVGLPAGLTIDPNTGVIRGTPTVPGVYDAIQVFLTDSAKIQVSKTLSLTVGAAPGIVGPSTVALVAGQAAVVDDLVALPGTASIPSTNAWSVTAGTLPAGLTLNPNTGEVSGTPSVVAKTTVTITLTDSATPTPLKGTKVLTFDVAAAPKFGSAAASNPAEVINASGVVGVKLPTTAPGVTPFKPVVVGGTAGVPKKGAFTAVPTGSSAALPDGIVFNPDTGAITGTPLVVGEYTFKVVFTDAKGLTAEQPYRFVVAAPPTITTGAMLPVYEAPASGVAPAMTPVDLGFEAATNTVSGTAAWSATGLPVGLTINPDTGVISGTPPATATKDFTFKVTLTDSGDVSGSPLVATKTFTLPVVKAGVNKTTLNLPVELAGGTLITDEVFDLNGDVPSSLAAVGASSMGLPVTYTTTATSATSCYVDADQMLHIIGTGVCGVVATSGTAANKNLSSATQSFTVSKRSQVLTVTAPGAVIPGSSPAETAEEATNDPAGFRISASLDSGLDPIYTVIPAKNPNGTDKDLTCSVDEAGTVTWMYDLTLAPTAPGYDANGNKCRVAISHPGNKDYGSVVTQFLDLVAAAVTPSAPSDDDMMDPSVSEGLPRTGGTISKGGVGFTVKVTPTGVTVQPISSGLYIGPITANISIEYKKNNVVMTQSCSTSFGIAIRDSRKNVITNPALETKAAIDAITKPYRAMPKWGAKGYLASKKFTNSVTCNLNKDAVEFFKAGGQLKANAEVIRDRRWPTTYKASKPNGEKILPRTVNWVLKVG